MRIDALAHVAGDGVDDNQLHICEFCDRSFQHWQIELQIEGPLSGNTAPGFTHHRDNVDAVEISVDGLKAWNDRVLGRVLCTQDDDAAFWCPLTGRQSVARCYCGCQP